MELWGPYKWPYKWVDQLLLLDGIKVGTFCVSLGINRHIFSDDDLGVQSPPKCMVFRFHCHSQVIGSLGQLIVSKNISGVLQNLKLIHPRENGPFSKEVLFQPSCFRGYVCFGGVYVCET